MRVARGWLGGVSAVALLSLSSPALVVAQDKPTETKKPIRYVPGNWSRFEEGPPALVWLQDGTNVPVAADILKEQGAIYAKIIARKEGDKVTLHVQGGRLVDLDLGVKIQQVTVPQEVKDVLTGSKIGDVLEISENHGPYKKAKLAKEWKGDAVEVRDRLIGKEDKFAPGIRAIPVIDVTAVKNLTHPEVGQPKPVDDGSRAADGEKVGVGDTIQIGFKEGRVIAIDLEKVTLRLWKDGEYVEKPEEVPLQMGGAPQKIERCVLYRNVVKEVPGGAILIKEGRSRLAARNVCEVTVEVSHSQRDRVLAGASIEYRAGPFGAPLSQAKLDGETKEIPVILFADEKPWKDKRRFEGQEEADSELQFKDGDPAKCFIAIASAEAKALILKSLATRKDPESLKKAIAAAVENKSSSVIRVLMTMHLEAPQGVPGDPLRQATEEALVTIGPPAAAVLVEEALRPDQQIQLLGVGPDGQEQPRPPSQPVVMKQKLLKLLHTIPGTLSGDRCGRLFWAGRDSLQLAPDILALFQARVEEAVPGLMEIATSVAGRNPPPEELQKAEDAAKFLRDLGKRAGPPAVEYVRALGASGAQLAAAITQAHGNKPQDMTEPAVRAVFELKFQERKQEIEELFQKAKGEVEAGDFEKALAHTQSVLDQDRDHTEAKKLLPTIRMKYGADLLKKKLRGEAAREFKAAGDIGKSQLGGILLEAAREEVEFPVLRAGPDQSFSAVRKLTAAEVLPIVPWPTPTKSALFAPVGIGKEKDGRPKIAYVRTNMVGISGEKATVPAEPGFVNALALLEDVRALSPDKKPQADETEADIYYGQAERLVEKGEYEKALVYYDKGEKLDATDERVGHRTSVWLKVNMKMFGIVGGIILVSGGFLGFTLLRRQKKVKHTGEFLYYGKDRAKVEREIDGNTGKPVEAPPPAEGGAPPANAPPAK